MKIASSQSREAKREDRILVGMIVNSTVLGKIASRWKEKGLFYGSSSNLIGRLCVEHYKQHGEPPSRGIEALLQDWADEGNKDPSAIKIASDHLISLSDQYLHANGDINPKKLLDLANEHITFVELKNLEKSLRENLEAKRTKKAAELVESFRKIELSTDSKIDLFNDLEEVKSTFAAQAEPVIQLNGAWGDFFGSVLARDRFVSFMAPEKTGKSFILTEMAYQAATQRRKTAFFAVGDMSDDEIKMRLLVRAASWPDESPTGKWPCIIKVPTKIRAPREGEDCARVVFEEESFDYPIDEEIAWNACNHVVKNKIKSYTSHLRLSCHPSGTINVAGIKGHLDSWALDGWEPDVVVIDYADILARPAGIWKDPREHINETWLQLRGLSQIKHCLVITATQTNRDSYERKLMDRRHISEEKRKLAHVSAMVAINRTGDEKEAQVYRLNFVGRRKGNYSTRKCVYLAECLALANPAVLTTW